MPRSGGILYTLAFPEEEGKEEPLKKTRKKGKVKRDRPPERGTMGTTFDTAMTRIARAPWPPKK